jgi:Fic family protein
MPLFFVQRSSSADFEVKFPKFGTFSVIIRSYNGKERITRKHEIRPRNRSRSVQVFDIIILACYNLIGGKFMNDYEPPFTLTNKIINLVAGIGEAIGRFHFRDKLMPNPRLRRENRIKTIHSSLAIENNTLNIEQITAIINGKRVLGMPSEIQEVKNAFEAYECILEFNPYHIEDLLRAHGLMMNSLVTEAGKFRSGGVGVFNGNKLIHMAPPAEFVREHIENLLEWVEKSDLHMLVKSCVFHYEFEFIHPFQDGNGRMGRMWQTLLLATYNLLFIYLPIETLIKERQQEYYRCLAEADAKADSSVFVEFLLQVIYDTLMDVREERLPEKVEKLMSVIDYEPQSAKELMARLGLTRNQTFREGYLKPALERGLIAMTDAEHLNNRNQKYYKR